MLNFLNTLLTDNGSHTYNIILTIITIALIISNMYNRIKYLCLEKAAERVAQIESDRNLTGPEKFAKVVLWINEDLPTIFKNKLVKIIIEKLVQFAYDESKEYTKNYVKRKTGYDISTLLENINVTDSKDSIDSKSDDCTNS